MTSLRSIITIGSTLAAACGGVTLGGHTVVAPVARPTAHVSAAGHAADVGATTTDGHTPRGLAAPDRVAASPTVLAARATTGCFVADLTPHDRTSPSDGAVDPARAVDHGRPRILPHAVTPWLDRGDVTCDAAHDHCLRDCTWLVSTDLGQQSWRPEVLERDATDEGWSDLDPSLPFVAFRSVPATRANLDVGALALASAEAPRPGSAWTHGAVEAIDWAAGTLQLRGHRYPYPLAFARVAILRTTGGDVEQLTR